MNDIFIFKSVLVGWIGSVIDRSRRSNATPDVRGLTDRLEQRLRTPGSFFVFLVASAVGISLLAEWAGLQLVIGSFFAGLTLGEVAGPGRLTEASSVVGGATYGFFGPLAFTFIGIEFAFGSVEAMPLQVDSTTTVTQ